MDQTNYYQYMKELEESESELKALKCKLENQVLAKTLHTVKALRADLYGNITDINDCCKYIVAHKQKLKEGLKRSQANCICIDRKCSQNIHSIIKGIETVFEYYGSIMTNNGDLDLAQNKEFIQTLTRYTEHSQQFCKNCAVLFNNVRKLKYPDSMNNCNSGDNVGVISSNMQQRLRRSELSESSFLNTFQSNNVSASSPLSVESQTLLC